LSVARQQLLHIQTYLLHSAFEIVAHPGRLLLRFQGQELVGNAVRQCQLACLLVFALEQTFVMAKQFGLMSEFNQHN